MTVKIIPGLEFRCTHSNLTEIKCKVCKIGKIWETVYECKREKDKNWGWSETEYYCNTCGVKYEFLPKQDLAIPVETETIVQVKPGLYMDKRSTSVFSKK